MTSNAKGKLVLASDHAGFELKEDIKAFLRELGYEVEDVGTYNSESVDYPDFSLKAAEKVAQGEAPRGILFCGTGIGDSIVANKVPGIRAALCYDTYTAQLSRAHNDANILVLPGWVVGKVLAKEIVRVWLETSFSGGRHSRRLEKIQAIEAKYLKTKTGT